MKTICRIISFIICILFSQIATASFQNLCLLTGTLLEDPQHGIFSIGKGEQEHEISVFDIKVLITKSEKRGRADHGCFLPNDKPYELEVRLEKAFQLQNYKKGDQVELIQYERDIEDWKDDSKVETETSYFLATEK
ncbi:MULTISPECIES: hypothetical protein [unclassified Gilliamella]|uniref:hypothetical protein n=1 Tax=unclassified Gilliamella TaxID=2685620 RepID=UPI002269D3E4|nr:MULTISPECIES: hypothetical protein [unclassified Gilliamella]MCX8600481.1 hypothetical protein [Gilliamella sp. B3722]MCX8608807.1 hypothetical protein [Gilliamella sp. B3771]MCX8609697.1 hypothetical protein [Gilliamella sp. B3891]MCX8612213.1 hypothetical protein [Gilliamella sp. B3773]MCX8616607.1 hypothetical protein [Gilliamella sp. B3770]